MDANLLARGGALGFSIAAPVGPIGLLCIRRSLSGGMAQGLATGLGAATADALYGCVAGFGMTTVAVFLSSWRPWMGSAGGAFLCYLGICAILRPGADPGGRTPTLALAPAYVSALALTLSNPATILSFAAVFAGLGLPAAGGYAGAGQFVAGVFLGSTAWWILLSSAAALARHRIGPAALAGVNRVSGLALVALGIAASLLSLH